MDDGRCKVLELRACWLVPRGGRVWGADHLSLRVPEGDGKSKGEVAQLAGLAPSGRLTQSVIGGTTSSSVYNGDGLRMSHTVSGSTTNFT
jgi:hypothetical protein